MSVIPSSRQKRLGLLAYQAQEANKLLWIKDYFSPSTELPKEPARMKQGDWGVIYYSFNLEGWTGCQHIDYIIIDGRIYS